MRTRVLFLMAVVALPACDLGHLGDQLFPTLPTQPPKPCSEATTWEITGFTGKDVVPGDGALPPAVRLDVGESRRLRAAPLEFYDVTYSGCDDVVALVRWTSTSPRIAAFAEGQGRESALTAQRAGDTEVSGEVVLKDGRTYRIGLGRYAEYQGQPVHRVRVFQPSAVPGRVVVFSGSVSLKPFQRTGDDARLPFEVPSPGTLDMVVDWRSPIDAVIGHLCPGTMEPGLGCVPVIDGNQSSMDKPQVGSAKVKAGTYTFWITNLGPADEVVHYEAGLVPD